MNKDFWLVVVNVLYSFFKWLTIPFRMVIASVCLVFLSTFISNVFVMFLLFVCSVAYVCLPALSLIRKQLYEG